MPIRRVLRLPVALVLASIAAPRAAQPPSTPPAPRDDADRVIRRRVDLVTSDVIVRSRDGRFVADLKTNDFLVFEDGVRQQLVTLTMSHGGRIFNLAPAGGIRQDGVVLPAPGPPSDGPGRMFLLFIDDLHLDFRQTGRLRELLSRLATGLIRTGDMFGVVSSGPSSLAQDFTYDRSRLDAVIRRVAGSALLPSEILSAPQSAQGAAEVRHRAHVAFATVYDMLRGMARIADRRKSLIYVSSGYDFEAFPESRGRLEAERSGRGSAASGGSDPFAPGAYKFGHADLVGELAEVTRAANRASTSIYTIDPRGLVAGPDIDQPVSLTEWTRHVQSAQDTLRVLADGAGGFAIVNQNDLAAGLQRIDEETSDYYVIGYYSTNADPARRRRAIEIRVQRPDVTVKQRAGYVPAPGQRRP